MSIEPKHSHLAIHFRDQLPTLFAAFMVIGNDVGI